MRHGARISSAVEWIKPLARLWLLLPIVFALFGCASPESNREQRKSAITPADLPINELNVLAVPVALNLDQAPGADGFVVKIYAGHRTKPKSVAIEKGILEILMYDGTWTETRQAPSEPLRVWSYTAEDLRRSMVRTAIGAGYEIIPRWGEARPTRDKFTVIARYTSPEGAKITSARSVISLTK